MSPRPEDVAAVEAANAALYRAVETGDLDLMEAVWDDGSAVACVHPGWHLLRGRGPVLRSWAAVMASRQYLQFILTDVAVEVTGDVAVVTCTENILAGVEDDATSFEAATVVATNVLRRRPSGWRVVLHHGSPVVASRGDAPAEGDT